MSWFNRRENDFFHRVANPQRGREGDGKNLRQPGKKNPSAPTSEKRKNGCVPHLGRSIELPAEHLPNDRCLLPFFTRINEPWFVFVCQPMDKSRVLLFASSPRRSIRDDKSASGDLLRGGGDYGGGGDSKMVWRGGWKFWLVLEFLLEETWWFVCLFVRFLFERMRMERRDCGGLWGGSWSIWKQWIGVICISVITFWFFYFFVCVLFKWHVLKDLPFFLLIFGKIDVSLK